MKSDRANLEDVLVGAEKGKVVVRFLPEPSGYLHIGHSKAALLNHYFASHYEGKMYLRFDDTNPTKENAGFEKAIQEDLLLIGIKPVKISHTSDYFETLIAVAKEMILKGTAYADNTPVETMRFNRDKGIASASRTSAPEESLAIFERMIAGTAPEYVIRAKLDMVNPNKCLRDPVMYRVIMSPPHHVTGSKYKVYPTYDFACPVVDSLEGISHALRSIEYSDRNAQYHWFTSNSREGLKPVTIYEFSRTNFVNTLLSKRKLTQFVESKVVAGWDDPRMPTIRGIVRRGMTVEALRDFALTQGASRNLNLMQWDKIWAFNKATIDPLVPRYAGIELRQASSEECKKADGQTGECQKGECQKPSSSQPGCFAKVIIQNFPLSGEDSSASLVDDKLGSGLVSGKIIKVPAHPKNPELGEKKLILSREVALESDDADTLAEGEQVTLMGLGNVLIEKIEKMECGASSAQCCPSNSTTCSSSVCVSHTIQGSFVPNGDFKKTKKLHWLPLSVEAERPLVAEVHYFDHLITKEKLEEDEDLNAFINRDSDKVKRALVQNEFVQKAFPGMRVQLERKGYYIVDRVSKDACKTGSCKTGSCSPKADSNSPKAGTSSPKTGSGSPKTGSSSGPIVEYSGFACPPGVSLVLFYIPDGSTKKAAGAATSAPKVVAPKDK